MTPGNTDHATTVDFVNKIRSEKHIFVHSLCAAWWQYLINTASLQILSTAFFWVLNLWLSMQYIMYLYAPYIPVALFPMIFQNIG
jgi:hypothetical protein